MSLLDDVIVADPSLGTSDPDDYDRLVDSWIDSCLNGEDSVTDRVFDFLWGRFPGAPDGTRAIQGDPLAPSHTQTPPPTTPLPSVETPKDDDDDPDPDGEGDGEGEGMVEPPEPETTQPLPLERLVDIRSGNPTGFEAPLRFETAARVLPEISVSTLVPVTFAFLCARSHRAFSFALVREDDSPCTVAEPEVPSSSSATGEHRSVLVPKLPEVVRLDEDSGRGRLALCFLRRGRYLADVDGFRFVLNASLRGDTRAAVFFMNERRGAEKARLLNSPHGTTFRGDREFLDALGLSKEASVQDLANPYRQVTFLSRTLQEFETPLSHEVEVISMHPSLHGAWSFSSGDFPCFRSLHAASGVTALREGITTNTRITLYTDGTWDPEVRASGLASRAPRVRFNAASIESLPAAPYSSVGSAPTAPSYRFEKVYASNFFYTHVPALAPSTHVRGIRFETPCLGSWLLRVGGMNLRLSPATPGSRFVAFVVFLIDASGMTTGLRYLVADPRCRESPESMIHALLREPSKSAPRPHRHAPIDASHCFSQESVVDAGTIASLFGLWSRQPPLGEVCEMRVDPRNDGDEGEETQEEVLDSGSISWGTQNSERGENDAEEVGALARPTRRHRQENLSHANPFAEDDGEWFFVSDPHGRRLGGLHRSREAALQELRGRYDERVVESMMRTCFSVCRFLPSVVAQHVAEFRRTEAFCRELLEKMEDPRFGVPRRAYLCRKPDGCVLPDLWTRQRDAWDHLKSLEAFKSLGVRCDRRELVGLGFRVLRVYGSSVERALQKTKEEIDARFSLLRATSHYR